MWVPSLTAGSWKPAVALWALHEVSLETIRRVMSPESTGYFKVMKLTNLNLEEEKISSQKVK